ncbi:hypothetical protein ACJVQT_23125 [Enterobacter huaxiensis]|uniref:hypothetical protein n=1 Tax=Enterobacter huaxiensis TaxID=2494702 RepID=UPI0021756E9A|nr:hypothetical protein [Enterobacter huaxiensis]MCS5452471.1 hypothetical protein [Enterobacter huaxiensis]
MQQFFSFGIYLLILLIGHIYHFAVMVRRLRAYAFIMRLGHIRSWNGVFNEQTIGYANDYARDYHFLKLFDLRKAFKAHIKKTFNGNVYTFMSFAASEGYKPKR